MDEHFPLFGHGYQAQDFGPIDLSVAKMTAVDLDFGDLAVLSSYLQSERDRSGSKILYGGYLEHRSFYKSSLFEEMQEARNIHLGVDFWLPALEPVYCPFDAQVHSFAINAKPLDYGGTIILRHEQNQEVFHTLYGHLSSMSMENKAVGDFVSAGTEIGWIGIKEENGGWLPHLHFQKILDMGSYLGDYPGVACLSELDIFSTNCPYPERILDNLISK